MFEKIKSKQINKIKDINKEIIEKIKNILIYKIQKKELNGKSIIIILSKLNHHFNDETFNWEQKKYFLNFIIKKCKDNDN